MSTNEIGLISKQLESAWSHIDYGYVHGLPVRVTLGMNLLTDAITRLNAFDREEEELVGKGMETVRRIIDEQEGKHECP